MELKGATIGAKQVYEAIEGEVGRIRVLYEIRPLQGVFVCVCMCCVVCKGRGSKE